VCARIGAQRPRTGHRADTGTVRVTVAECIDCFPASQSVAIAGGDAAAAAARRTLSDH
jgi:hypothetical protein